MKILLSAGWVFDEEQYGSLTESRKSFLDELFDSLRQCFDLTTAVDVGCGIGTFSNYLAAQGLRVLGIDARQGNVDEAARRNPEIEFAVCDIEKASGEVLGTFDLCLCFGLLYHLENPFAAIRALGSLTGDVLALESLVAPGKHAAAHFRQEYPGEDQGLTYLALVPTEPCLVKMLYAAGFTVVYRPIKPVGHNEFKPRLRKLRRRTMLIASREPLKQKMLKEIKEPDIKDPWIYPPRLFRRILSHFQS